MYVLPIILVRQVRRFSSNGVAAQDQRVAVVLTETLIDLGYESMPRRMLRPGGVGDGALREALCQMSAALAAMHRYNTVWGVGNRGDVYDAV